MLALLHGQADESLDTDLEYAAGNVLKLFDDIESTIQDLDMKYFSLFLSVCSSYSLREFLV
jgi:hypothetical protein